MEHAPRLEPVETHPAPPAEPEIDLEARNSLQIDIAAHLEMDLSNFVLTYGTAVGNYIDTHPTITDDYRHDQKKAIETVIQAILVH